MLMSSEDSCSFLNFSLEQRALSKLAKICWGDTVLQAIIDLEDAFKPSILITHRKTVINNLTQILETVDNEYLTDITEPITNKLIDAIFRVEQGYFEAISWEERCDSCLPFTIFDPETAGKYQARLFIDPSGHFDDLAWVKLFVADDYQFIHNRFEFACLYCFEEKIREIWCSMKTKRQLPCKGRLDIIDIVCGPAVGIWAYELENEFEYLPEEDRRYGPYTRSENINVHGLVIAIFEGHEYAVQYFWSQCRKTESFSILDDIIGFVDILSYVSNLNYVGVVHFLYSNLSQEEKNRAFVLNGEVCLKTVDVWTCLLISPFYDCALTDILHFPHPISAPIYDLIFNSLALKFSESGAPIHKKVFDELWNHLSHTQKNEVVKIREILRSRGFIDILEKL